MQQPEFRLIHVFLPVAVMVTAIIGVVVVAALKAEFKAQQRRRS